MANRNSDLIKVWDGQNLIEKNIDFLRTPTKTITFPLSPHIEQIITDLKDTFLQYYYDNPTKKLAAGAAGRKHAKEHYDWHGPIGKRWVDWINMVQKDMEPKRKVSRKKK